MDNMQKQQKAQVVQLVLINVMEIVTRKQDNVQRVLEDTDYLMERVHNAQVERMLQLEQQQNVKIVLLELIQELEQHHVRNVKQEHQHQQSHHHVQNVQLEHMRKKELRIVCHVHQLVKMVVTKQQDYVEDVHQDLVTRMVNVKNV